MPSKELVNILSRLTKIAEKKRRQILISNDVSRKKFDISEFLSDELQHNQDSDHKSPHRTIYVTLHNLGMQDEKNRIRWPSLRYPLYRRLVNYSISLFCSLLPASRFKNLLYRMIGYKIGRNVEIAQTAILDPFCPALIEIRSDTMIGSFAKIFSHAYKGRGEVIIGKVTIGENCRVLASAIIGPINIENNVVVMVNTSLTPYFRRVKNGTVVGHDKPTVKNIDILSKQQDNPGTSSLVGNLC